MKKIISISFGLGILIFAGCSIQAPDKNQIKENINEGSKYLGEKGIEFIETNESAQKVMSGANQLLEEGKNKANQTVEDVKKEALNQYEQFKEDIKSNVKDTVNKKIDESFDKI